jgi:hypothetical protein
MVLVAWGWAQGAIAEGPPKFDVLFLGNGGPVAVNNQGTVAGARLVGGSVYQPLVSQAGLSWVALPLPNGATQAFPTDLNQSDVIVGVAFDAQFNAVGVRWTPGPMGYAVEILPRLPGDASSYPTGLNNLGEIVGARRALGYVPAATTGWLISQGTMVVDLLAEYGLGTYPNGLNDYGEVLSGTGVLSLETGEFNLVGTTGPANYQPIAGIDINNLGQIVGTAPLRSGSLNVISVFRYTPGTGWEYLYGTSKWTTAQDINNLGDVGFSELGAGVALSGVGIYPLGELLDPEARAAGWVVTGAGCYLNDHRMVATAARNDLTGQSGGVLLIPDGLLPPPPAPTGLQGTAHPSTPLEPFNAINLSWSNAGPLTRSYELERTVTGQGAWQSIPLVPPGSGTTHTDTTISLGVTYDYRVRGVGVAGPGPWSTPVTVTAPSPPQGPFVKVSAITLTGRVVGRNVSLTGIVTVVNEQGQPVRDATVAVQWALPGGAAATAQGVTTKSGQVRFTRTGPRGTYVLRVTNVTKSGFTFNQAGSQLEQSITK